MLQVGVQHILPVPERVWVSLKSPACPGLLREKMGGLSSSYT